MYLRLTGTVAERTDKPWAKGDRSGTIPECIVAINEFLRTRVTLGKSIAGSINEGDDVDLLVEVDKNSQGYLNVRSDAHYPVTDSRHSAAPLASV